MGSMGTVQVLSFDVQFKKPRNVAHFLSATLRVQRGETLYIMFTRVLLRNLFSTLKFPNNLELPNLINTQVEDYAIRIEGHPTSK